MPFKKERTELMTDDTLYPFCLSSGLFSLSVNYRYMMSRQGYWYSSHTHCKLNNTIQQYESRCKTNEYWKLTVSFFVSWTTKKFFEATLQICCLFWLIKILETSWVGVRPKHHWLSIGFSFSRSWQQPLIHWFLHRLSCHHCCIWNEQWKNTWLNDWYLSKSKQCNSYLACKHVERKVEWKEKMID